MATAVARNEPCPCGSGKKYKRCCIDKGPPEQRRKRALVPGLVVALSLGAGVLVGVSKGWSAGAAAGGGGLMLAILVYIFYDPPPPRGDGSHPAGINFGG